MIFAHLGSACMVESATTQKKPSRNPCRLVEDADLQAAKDLFGADLDLDKMQPKSAKDFEDLARALAAKYLHPHGRRCGLHVLGRGGRCIRRMPGWLRIVGLRMPYIGHDE